MVGEAAEYNSACVNTLRRSQDGYKLPGHQSGNSWWPFVFNRDERPRDMKKLVPLVPILFLSGCVSPAAQMSPDQLASLTNQQLCELTWAYPYEVKTQVEIGQRGINCDPAHIECSNMGLQDGTPGFANCLGVVNERNELSKNAQPSPMSSLQSSIERMRLRRQQDDYHQLNMERQRIMLDNMKKNMNKY